MTDKTEKIEEIEENVVADQAETLKAVPVKVKAETMEDLIAELGDNLLPFAEDDTVEATVLAVGGNRIWVDVAGQSLGFIHEKEISSKTGLVAGDKILCTVIHMEDDAGNVVLSMRRADREKYWRELEQGFESGEPVTIKVTDANKGGLMTEIGGIQGFLPVSQLSPAKYPRVTGGDKDEILNRLRQFIGQDIPVKVINCDKESNKLIFSEKAVRANEVSEKISNFQVGDKVKGRITGIVDFGLFVSLDPQIEGLVHISEISWSRVSDLHKLFKVNDEVEVMIISTDDGKISLSIKRLLPDPWAAAASKYKVGQVTKGAVTKITPFGAFVSLDAQIDGLVHISELSANHVVDPAQVVGLGKEYQFKIISIEPESHRLGLSLKVDEGKEAEKKEEKSAKENPAEEEKPAKKSKKTSKEPNEENEKAKEEKPKKASKKKADEDTITKK